MGVECYLVRLRGPRRDGSEVAAYARAVLGAVLDPQPDALSGAHTHYALRSGPHVIEIELFQDGAACEVSLRFALCHPPSVDPEFIALTTDLMRQFDLVATICEELPEGEPRDYTAVDLGRFASNCTWSIARAREGWRQMFGSEEAGLSTLDCVRRFMYGEAV